MTAYDKDATDRYVAELRAALAAESRKSLELSRVYAERGLQIERLELALSRAAATAPQPVAGDDLTDAELADPEYMRAYVASMFETLSSFVEGAAQSARQIATLHAVIGELAAELGNWRLIETRRLDVYESGGNWYADSRGPGNLGCGLTPLAAISSAAPTGSGE